MNMGVDCADWEFEEGLPQFEDPFIQQYLKGREALIAEERKRRHGAIGSFLLCTDFLILSRCHLSQISIANSRPRV